MGAFHPLVAPKCGVFTPFSPREGDPGRKPRWPSPFSASSNRAGFQEPQNLREKRGPGGEPGVEFWARLGKIGQ